MTQPAEFDRLVILIMGNTNVDILQRIERAMGLILSGNSK